MVSEQLSHECEYCADVTVAILKYCIRPVARRSTIL